jgi:hypothetical protein
MKPPMRARAKFVRAATLALLMGAAAAALYIQLAGSPAKTIEPPRRGVSVAQVEPGSAGAMLDRVPSVVS